MAKLGVIADPQPVPTWVASCPTCGGPVQCGIEEWESATGIVTPGGLYVDCMADDHEGAIETRMPYVYWGPVRERVLAWARLALRKCDDGSVRPTTSREVWRVMAEGSAIRKGLTPWGSLSPTRFMREATEHEPTGGDTFAQPRATLTVAYRHDVQTRQWWTLTWVSEGGERRSVEASSLGLLMERAAAIELEAIARAERDWEGAEEVRHGAAGDGAPR